MAAAAGWTPLDVPLFLQVFETGSVAECDLVLFIMTKAVGPHGYLRLGGGELVGSGLFIDRHLLGQWQQPMWHSAACIMAAAGGQFVGQHRCLWNAEAPAFFA